MGLLLLTSNLNDPCSGSAVRDCDGDSTSQLLGCPTGASYWGVLLGCPTGVSYWGVLLGCPTGASYWGVLLGRPTGVSYWGV